MRDAADWVERYRRYWDEQLESLARYVEDETVSKDENLVESVTLEEQLVPNKYAAEDYHFDIPLIQGENVRVKLAKLAICFAGRLYSCSENGEELIVEKIHVRCATLFLNNLYKSGVSGYGEFSEGQFEKSPERFIEQAPVVENYFRSYIDKEMLLIRCLLHNSTINTQTLCEQVNVSSQLAHEIISTLSRCNALSKRGTIGYVKNPGFTNWLKERERTIKKDSGKPKRIFRDKDK